MDSPKLIEDDAAAGKKRLRDDENEEDGDDIRCLNEACGIGVFASDDDAGFATYDVSKVYCSEQCVPKRAADRCFQLTGIAFAALQEVKREMLAKYRAAVEDAVGGDTKLVADEAVKYTLARTLVVSKRGAAKRAKKAAAAAKDDDDGDDVDNDDDDVGAPADGGDNTGQNKMAKIFVNALKPNKDVRMSTNAIKYIGQAKEAKKVLDDELTDKHGQAYIEAKLATNLITPASLAMVDYVHVGMLITAFEEAIQLALEKASEKRTTVCRALGLPIDVNVTSIEERERLDLPKKKQRNGRWSTPDTVASLGLKGDMVRMCKGAAEFARQVGQKWREMQYWAVMTEDVRSVLRSKKKQKHLGSIVGAVTEAFNGTDQARKQIEDDIKTVFGGLLVIPWQH